MLYVTDIIVSATIIIGENISKFLIDGRSNYDLLIFFLQGDSICTLHLSDMCSISKNKTKMKNVKK